MVSVFYYLDKYRLTEEESIKVSSRFDYKDIEIYLDQTTHFGKVVLFGDNSRSRFGIARLENKYKILWKARTTSYFPYTSKDVPFEVIGEHISNSEKVEQFIVGFKSNNKDINIVVCGPENEEIKNMLKEYQLNLNEFLIDNQSYTASYVKNSFALMLQDEYNVANWNFFAFDINGNLIATKIAGSGDAKYIQD